jgi:segregation and condensation protein B
MTESYANEGDRAPSLKTIVEAILFAADEPLSARRMATILEEATPGVIDDIVAELNADYQREDRAFRIHAIAGGYRMLTRPEYALWIKLLQRSSRPRLSQAALETLSIIAYRQPVPRTELEAIRGVNVDGVLKTLVERDLVRIAGLEALPRPEEVELEVEREAGQPELFEEPAPESGTA